MTYQELFSSVDLLVLWRVFPAAGRNECDRLKINLSACVNGNEGTCHTVHVQCVFNSLCKKLWLHEQYFQPWASKSLKRAEKDHIWEITSYILMWRSPNRTNSEYCITDLLPQLPVLLGCSKHRQLIQHAHVTHTHTCHTVFLNPPPNLQASGMLCWGCSLNTPINHFTDSFAPALPATPLATRAGVSRWRRALRLSVYNNSPVGLNVGVGRACALTFSVPWKKLPARDKNPQNYFYVRAQERTGHWQKHTFRMAFYNCRREKRESKK